MKTARVFSIILLAIVAVNALAAGYSFMSDPSGRGLGISTDRLKYSPFNDYFIPGLVLFVANGVFTVFTLTLISIKYKNYPLWIVIQGSILLGWIIVQVIFLREFNFLHFLFIVIGALIMLSGVRLNKLMREGWS